VRRAVLALVLAAGCGDDAAETPWVKGPPLPGPRLEPGVIAYRDAIWVIGGFDENLLVSRDVWILDADATEWRPGPEAPAALTHMNLAVAGDTLYLLGGLEGRGFVENGECWRLVDEATGWEPLAVMPDGMARGAAATSVSTEDMIVVAGGATETETLASVLIYQPSTDTWTVTSELPSPRAHAIGATGGGGEPFVIGGLATLDATYPLDDVLAAVDGTFMVLGHLGTARGGCAAAEVDGLLYCAGGEAGDDALAVVEVSSGKLDWTEVAPLPEPRAGAGAAGHDGALYVVGGAHRLAWEPIADVDVLVPN
jgi:hypothetical protein